MTSKSKTKYDFVKVWMFPEPIEQFIKSKIEGYSLHVCCGSSKLGDVRLDKEPQDEGVILGDMFKLSYKEEFDTVICDPPWNLGYHLRPKLMYNLRDAIKPGGKLILNCTWFPSIKHLKLTDMFYCKPHNPFVNGGFIGIYKKYQSQLDRFQTDV